MSGDGEVIAGGIGSVVGLVLFFIISIVLGSIILADHSEMNTWKEMECNFDAERLVRTDYMWPCHATIETVAYPAIVGWEGNSSYPVRIAWPRPGFVLKKQKQVQNWLAAHQTGSMYCKVDVYGNRDSDGRYQAYIGPPEGFGMAIAFIVIDCLIGIGIIVLSIVLAIIFIRK
jgi:hypothetical protein